MQTLLQISLITHIVGITFMAGATLVEYLFIKHFWKRYASDRLGAIASIENGFNFHRMVDIGVVLLILSGVTMFLIFHGIFAKQIWFQIKIGLIVIIALNGSIIGRRQDKKLKELLSLEKGNLHQKSLLGQENYKKEIIRMKNWLSLFYITQLLMFLTIFTLSFFKFN